MNQSKEVTIRMKTSWISKLPCSRCDRLSFWDGYRCKVHKHTKKDGKLSRKPFMNCGGFIERKPHPECGVEECLFWCNECAGLDNRIDAVRRGVGTEKNKETQIETEAYFSTASMNLEEKKRFALLLEDSYREDFQEILRVEIRRRFVEWKEVNAALIARQTEDTNWTTFLLDFYHSLYKDMIKSANDEEREDIKKIRKQELLIRHLIENSSTYVPMDKISLYLNAGVSLYAVEYTEDTPDLNECRRKTAYFTSSQEASEFENGDWLRDTNMYRLQGR